MVSLTPFRAQGNLTFMKALVLSAGHGKRMCSSVPKVLHPILGRPLLGWVLKALEPLNCEEILVVCGPEGAVIDFLKDKGVKTVIQEERLGTGHAVMVAEKELLDFSGTLLILYGDTPLLRSETLKGLLDHHKEKKATFTLLSAVLENPKGYGRIIRDQEGRPKKIVEESDLKGEQSNEINGGVYAVETPFLFKALREIQPNNRQGEYYLTDIVEIAYRWNERVETFFTDWPLEVLGVNTRLDLSKAEEILRQKIVEKWALEGVTIEDPKSTWIEPEVKIERDTVIRPFCFLRGKTSIGPNSTIGPFVEIIDSEIGEGVKVDFCSHIEGSFVGNYSKVGPFSRLRPGSRLEEGVKVGNFVEVKNSRLGRGSKANHLAYLGDAEIGEEVNVGAGTITCNFDGKTKHRTIIGDRVFIGSNVSLVAPIVVGDDATIGAGSVITKEVPEGSLAVERSKQKIIPNWSRRRK